MNKKEKNKKVKKPMSSKKFTVFCVLMGIVSAITGAVGGYFLYNIFKPETKYETGYVDYYAINERVKTNKNQELKQLFKDDPYNLANYAFYNFGNKKYSLSLSNGIVNNISGDQNVRAITLNYDGDCFNQNISATTGGGPIKINTAYRFYDLNKDDDKNYSMEAYENKLESDWKEGLKPTRTYSYDQYINDYGKLLKGNYVVDNNDKYVSNNYSDYKKGANYLISGATIYQIYDTAVEASKIENTDDGYKILISLDASKACSYYMRQIKKNGGMTKNPTFTSSINLEVNLDKNYNLVSTHSNESYNVILGAQVTCKASFDIYYYSSDEVIKFNNGSNNVSINIPSISEKFPISLNRDSENNLKIDFVE